MESYCSLCTLDTIHILFFVTRLILNKINKVQLVDFKLENVLVSLHSLKNNRLRTLRGLGSIMFKEWRVTGTFSYTHWIRSKVHCQISSINLKWETKVEHFNYVLTYLMYIISCNLQCCYIFIVILLLKIRVLVFNR